MFFEIKVNLSPLLGLQLGRILFYGNGHPCLHRIILPYINNLRQYFVYLLFYLKIPFSIIIKSWEYFKLKISLCCSYGRDSCVIGRLSEFLWSLRFSVQLVSFIDILDVEDFEDLTLFEGRGR